MAFVRRNKIFANRARRNRWIQLVIVIIVLLGLFYGMQAIFSKSFKVDRYLRSAKNLTLKNSFDKANDELNKAYSLDPNNPAIYDGLGYLNIHKDEIDKASEFYQKALDKGLKNTTIFDHRDAGYDFISKGKYNNAFVEFQQYNKLEPKDLKGVFGLALSYHGLGKELVLLTNINK